MSKMLNAALDFMGFLNTDEDDSSEIVETRSPKNNDKLISLSSKTSQPTIVHIVPKEFDDVMDITKRLQNKMIVTINLSLVDMELSKRIIDFAGGAVYALDGGILKLADNVYLLAVQGVMLHERDASDLR